jgi:hypothetical protein
MTPEQHEELARSLFNRVWELMESERTPAQDMEMVHAAHASRHHWAEAGPSPVRLARGEWQLSRVYLTVGRQEPALVHAHLALQLSEEHHLDAFDRAYAHEANARAQAEGGRRGAARRHLVEARRLLDAIDDPEHRALLEADLATIEP